MHIDSERCVRAVRSKDARFDGWFFTAVLTTRIYCRPSCPVVPPKPANMTFYPSAAACQQAGFRACKRCRPDTSPGSPEWNQRADLVARAMRLIGDGVVDREGVPGLATRLGYSTRQIERQLLAELGAGPLALARAQRAQTARLLIETTSLPMAEIAFAAGFSSIRTFNDTVREVFALSPSELRGRLPKKTVVSPGALTLRLPFRAPLNPDNLFGHLAATAVPGVEEWRDGAYRRTLRLPYGHGIVALTPAADHIGCRLSLSDLRDLPVAISRCRRMLDLDADPVAIDDQLRADPLLAPLVDKAPGRRVPRTVDEAEFAVRAVLGQQVSTAAARTHAARLVTAHGEAVTDPEGASPTSSRPPRRWPPSPPSRSRCPVPAAPPSPRWSANWPRADFIWAWRATGRRPAPGSCPSPASAPGPRTSSRCAPSATPTRSCPPTSESGARPRSWACRPHRPRSPHARRPGGRGGRTRSSTCGRRTATRSTSCRCEDIQ
ncbi:hypothetical protein SAV31267_076860 [Streptomyces avermitilis]|nr:hypothetical protein SAVMC3_23030 [Streptomyces avermitilis]GDY78201.1 hypothetical protein SAV31267_076860 [Streptomyces avermitilis]